jgi:hypothetical protein
MSTIFDQTLDLNGQELHRIVSVYPLPEFVKNASHADVCGDQDTPPHAFADITRKLYPTHTPAATVVSTIFFNEKKAELPKLRRELIGEKLARAADYWKVLPTINEMFTQFDSTKSAGDTALANDEFAVVFTNKDGTPERHYPMRNPGETKAASAWLLQNRDKLPFEDRRKIADRVLEKAAKFGLGLPQERHDLEKMAGLGACSGKDAAGLIRCRIRAVGHTHKPNELQNELEKLAQLCESAPRAIQHFGALTKIASLIDQFDREHGLTGKYDNIIERPEDVLFGVTEKVAADLSDDLIGSVLTGKYYKKADLEKLAVQDLADVLGDDFAGAVTNANAWVDTAKLAKIVPTLPLDDADKFDEIVSAAGIAPFATKAASVGKSISLDDQVKLAHAHKPAPGSLWDRVKR